MNTAKFIFVSFVGLVAGVTVPLIFFNPLKKNDAPLKLNLRDFSHELKADNQQTFRDDSNQITDNSNERSTDDGNTTARTSINGEQLPDDRRSQTADTRIDGTDRNQKYENQALQTSAKIQSNFLSMPVHCFAHYQAVNLRYYPSLDIAAIATQVPCNRSVIDVITPQRRIYQDGTQWLLVSKNQQYYWIAAIAID